MQNQPYEKPMSVKEVADLEGVTVESVRDWLTIGISIKTAKGKRRIALNGRKVGGRWRVLRSDLNAFIDASTNASASSGLFFHTRTIPEV